MSADLYISLYFIASLGSVRIVKKCDRGLENAVLNFAAFVFHHTDRPEAGKKLVYFFPAINWLTSGLFTPLCLSQLTCLVQMILKKLPND